MVISVWRVTTWNERYWMHDKNTPHFPQSAFSTLGVFHTRRFPHSAFSTLGVFHTRRFPHSSFSTLLVFHTPRFPHSILSTKPWFTVVYRGLVPRSRFGGSRTKKRGRGEGKGEEETRSGKIRLRGPESGPRVNCACSKSDMLSCVQYRHRLRYRIAFCFKNVVLYI